MCIVYWYDDLNVGAGLSFWLMPLAAYPLLAKDYVVFYEWF